MRCREGKHHVCPKLGVRWGGWQQLGALWDLIQRRSHSCWPTLSSGLAWISQKSNDEETNGKVWINCFSFVLYLFLFSSKRNISWQPALSNWALLKKGFLASQAALWSKNVCIWPQRSLTEVWEPQICVRIRGQISPSLIKLLVMVSPDWCSWSGLLTKVWFIQPK